MFNNVDQALEDLISDRMPGVHLAFVAPTRSWAGQAPDRSANIYLYDVCEDLERRQAGSVRVSGKQSPLALEADPPRYARLSYLISTWAAAPQDAHGLLGLLFAALAPVRSLDVGTGRLGFETVFDVGRPWDRDRTHTELWSALDNTLAPSLHATVSIPLPAYEYPSEVPAVLFEPFVTILPEVKKTKTAGGGTSGEPVRGATRRTEDLS